MISNSQVIIILLIILILLQLYQLFGNNFFSVEKENFVNFKPVDYNTKLMNCDGSSNMLNSKCIVKSRLPTSKNVCNKNLTLEDGPNYNTNAGQAVLKDIRGMDRKLSTSDITTIEPKKQNIKIENKEEDNSLLNELMNEDRTEEIKSVGELDN